MSIAQALFANHLTTSRENLGIAGADASAVASGGLTTTLTQGLSGEARTKMAVLGVMMVINETPRYAMTRLRGLDFWVWVL